VRDAPIERAVTIRSAALASEASARGTPECRTLALTGSSARGSGDLIVTANALASRHRDPIIAGGPAPCPVYARFAADGGLLFP
jgi:hypothetical protein